MNKDADRYNISAWLAEFTDPAMEKSFREHVRISVVRHFRIAVVVWIVLLLLFAIPDYIALGAVRPFYYLLAFRLVTVAVLVAVLILMKPETDFSRLSHVMMWVTIAYITSFMLFFIYRPEFKYVVIVVIMIQLTALLLFLPIRFISSLISAVYGVAITVVTRFVLGAEPINLLALVIILLLPVGVGALTANRNGTLQRKEFVQLTKLEKANRQLQKALSEIKELSGLLPICSSCKKIRNDNGYWEQIEGYIRDHSKAEFSHSICPDCAKKLYPTFYKVKH